MRPSRSMLVWLFVAAIAPPIANLNAQAPAPQLSEEAKALRDHVIANYTKYEYQIPMRDGVKLFTAVYVPKDTTRTFPFMLNRTPYSVAPYGVDNYRLNLGPSSHFQKEGFIFVYQDVRGRWMSEGTFLNVRPHNPNKGPKDFDESSEAELDDNID